MDTADIITTIAGNGISGFYGDNGSPLLAELNIPVGVAVSNSGDVYIGDAGNYRVRLITMHPNDITSIFDQRKCAIMYPNPANQDVTIEVNSKGNNTVIITDVLGRIIYQDSFTVKMQIPVHWQAGVYYVQVASENEYKEVYKLIVQ